MRLGEGVWRASPTALTTRQTQAMLLAWKAQRGRQSPTAQNKDERWGEAHTQREGRSEVHYPGLLLAGRSSAVLLREGGWSLVD